MFFVQNIFRRKNYQGKKEVITDPYISTEGQTKAGKRLMNMPCPQRDFPLGLFGLSVQKIPPVA
jgi:hypothetical protein